MNQEEIERWRREQGRCAMCGSTEVRQTGTATHCETCRYAESGGYVLEWRPFIAPGDPGSHDTEGEAR